MSEETKQRKQELADVSFVLSDKRGMRFLRRILEQAGTERLSFAAGQTDLTAFNEGNRNIGLFIESEIIDADPNKWIEVRRAK